MSAIKRFNCQWAALAGVEMGGGGAPSVRHSGSENFCLSWCVTDTVTSWNPGRSGVCSRRSVRGGLSVRLAMLLGKRGARVKVLSSAAARATGRPEGGSVRPGELCGY